MILDSIRGDVRVIYGVPDAQPLPMEGDFRLIQIASNELLTSSLSLHEAKTRGVDNEYFLEDSAGVRQTLRQHHEGISAKPGEVFVFLHRHSHHEPCGAMDLFSVGTQGTIEARSTTEGHPDFIQRKSNERLALIERIKEVCELP